MPTLADTILDGASDSSPVDAILNGSQQQSTPQPSNAVDAILGSPSTTPTNNSQGEPADVQAAESDIGDQSYDGYCEAFQEKATGSSNMGGTAAEAWQNQLNDGSAVADPNLQGAKAGDKVYFTGDNGLGHTGILINPQTGSFVSAEDSGVSVDTLAHWTQYSGESVLGYVPVN